MTGVPKITFFVKGQGIRWVGRVMRRQDSANLKALVDWSQTEYRPRRRLKK